MCGGQRQSCEQLAAARLISAPVRLYTELKAMERQLMAPAGDHTRLGLLRDANAPNPVLAHARG